MSPSVTERRQTPIGHLRNAGAYRMIARASTNPIRRADLIAKARYFIQRARDMNQMRDTCIDYEQGFFPRGQQL